MDLRKRRERLQAWIEILLRFRWLAIPFSGLIVFLLGKGPTSIERILLEAAQLNSDALSSLFIQFPTHLMWSLPGYVFPVALLFLWRWRFGSLLGALHFIVSAVGIWFFVALLAGNPNVYPALVGAMFMIAVTGFMFGKTSWLITLPVLVFALLAQLSVQSAHLPSWDWFLFFGLLHTDWMTQQRITQRRLTSGHVKKGAVIWAIKGSWVPALGSTVILSLLGVTSLWITNWKPWGVDSTGILIHSATYLLLSQVFLPTAFTILPLGRVMKQQK